MLRLALLSLSLAMVPVLPQLHLPRPLPRLLQHPPLPLLRHPQLLRRPLLALYPVRK